MSKQAVIEPAPAQVAGPPDEQAAPPAERDAAETLIAQELLVEEVSIDGMCGVY